MIEEVGSMPELAGFSHVSLSVRDLDKSVAFYRDVLGFAVFEEPPGHGWVEAVMMHPTGAVLCLQCHDANAGEGFDPVRTGMDHLAFKVTDRAHLDAWVEHLAAQGVTHSPIADMPYGSVLSYRDPDDIQGEIFYREGH